MSTYQKFEDLPVWQASSELYDRIDDLIDRAPPRMRAAFRAKLEQAALALAHNIAAAFVRGKEGLPFLDAAHATAADVQALSSTAARQPYLSALKPDLGEIRQLAETCGRQLYGWAEKIQHPQGKPQFQRRASPNGGAGERASATPERSAAPAARPRYER